MLRYFWKSLQLFILAELQNNDLKLKNFVQILKKIIVIKAKANLGLWATICNINQNCPGSFQLANTIVATASSLGNS